MGNKTTFVRKLLTGNLPSTIAASARPFAVAKETKTWTATEGNRLAFVGFKLTKKMIEDLPDDSIIPSSFAVDVPIVSYADLNCNRAGDFLTALVHDYQDSIISASANKETTVDPLNWQEMVTDYFDTTRGGVTQAMLKEWIEDVFEPTMIQRQVDLNLTAVAEGRKVKSDSEMQAFCKGHKAYLTAVLPKGALVEHARLRSSRQTIERFVELELFAADDVCVVWFLEKINLLLATDESVMEAAA